MNSSDLEKFIDDRLNLMAERTFMFGTIDSLESQGFLLIELYFKFVLEPHNVDVNDSIRDDFQAFRRKVIPKCPSPMILSQWFTDKEYGTKENLTEREAATKLVEFFIAWKSDIKSRY